ncbi:MAG: hypothetical protein ACK55I_14070, partial [bacterium]
MWRATESPPQPCGRERGGEDRPERAACQAPKARGPRPPGLSGRTNGARRASSSDRPPRGPRR